MAILPIIKHPDAVLGRTAKPVQRISPQIRTLLDEMVETMRAATGQGLAAPQVGLLKRVIVVEVSPRGLIELINPEIIASSEAQNLALEGCLSMPGLAAEVRRHDQVRVSALDRRGHRFWLEADGELARCLQHEIDHLDGILMTDRALRLFQLEPDAIDTES